MADDPNDDGVYVRGKRYEGRDFEAAPPPPRPADPAVRSRHRTPAEFKLPVTARVAISIVGLAAPVALLTAIVVPGISLGADSFVILFLVSLGSLPFVVWILRDMWR